MLTSLYCDIKHQYDFLIQLLKFTPLFWFFKYFHTTNFLPPFATPLPSFYQKHPLNRNIFLIDIFFFKAEADKKQYLIIYAIKYHNTANVAKTSQYRIMHLNIYYIFTLCTIKFLLELRHMQYIQKAHTNSTLIIMH
jgi:hypothetical protein